MDQQTRVVALYAYGFGVTRISSMLGITIYKVKKILALNSVALRPPGGDRGQRKNWKGGKTITSQGYVYLRVAEDADEQVRSMAYSNGYVAEHRLVMATYLGRSLFEWEQVHHRDGNRANNNIENLQLRIKAHGAGAAFRCADCGSINLTPEDI